MEMVDFLYYMRFFIIIGNRIISLCFYFNFKVLHC